MRAEMAWIRRWALDERPYLGLCLGAQLLAAALGGRVAPHPRGVHEIGFFPVRPTAAGAGVLPDPLHVYQWHNEGFGIPDGAELLAEGDVFPNQAFRYGSRAFGLQFHPEATGPMRREWLAASPHVLSAPGAHDPHRQARDARRFDRPMAAWLTGFIDGALLQGVQS